MTEYDVEPIPGLPGIPPPGERILWQGSPDWRMLARTAFHTRAVTGYFALLAGWATAGALAGRGGFTGVGATLLAGALGLALLHLIAFASARSTIYTLTNRRIVLRIGIALPKCINLPLGAVMAVDLATRADGTGDLPIAVRGRQRLGYAMLWPHARPWRVATPQPMLRAVPDAADVAALIARTCRTVQPEGVVARAAPRTQPIPALAEAAAA